MPMMLEANCALPDVKQQTLTVSRSLRKHYEHYWPDGFGGVCVCFYRELVICFDIGSWGALKICVLVFVG